MVFGGTDTEHIQFNEDSLWIGDEADAKWCMGNNRQPVLWLMHCSYIEIKKTASPGSKDIRSFSVLQRQNTVVGHGAVICLAQRRLPITREVDSVPIGEL
jgi:hypothetical protein